MAWAARNLISTQNLAQIPRVELMAARIDGLVRGRSEAPVAAHDVAPLPEHLAVAADLDLAPRQRSPTSADGSCAI